MNHEFQNLGHFPSPKDKRDFLLSKVSAPVPIPISYFSDLSKVPVLYQGKQPACTGHAAACGMMYLDNGAYSFDYSPRFLYALSKQNDGIPDQPGTYYRQALKEGQLYGVCDNTQFDNDISLDLGTYKDASKISMLAFTVAKDRKIKNYLAVDDLSWNGIKQAIYQNKIVLLGVKLGKEWWTDSAGNISWLEKDILPVKRPAQIVSGHAILAYGYDENYIYFRNSFSKNWGRNGDGYFDASYMPFVYEGWTFADLAPDVVDNLKQQISLYQKVVKLLQQLLGK